MRFLLLALTALIAAGCARQGELEAERAAPEGSPPGAIGFEGRNLFRTVHHRFERWRFTRFEWQDGVGEGRDLRGEAELEIELASVETGSEWLNRRARSPEFLDVERYPTATLWIGNVRPLEGSGGDSGSSRYRADVELKLRGVRQRQGLEFELISTSPPRVRGEAVFRRSVFGIGPPYRWFNPFSIRDEVRVRFEAAIPVGESPASRAELQAAPGSD